MPVFLALGIATYFQLEIEPPFWPFIVAALALFLALSLLKVFLKRRLSRSVQGTFLTVTLFLTNQAMAFVVGFASAQIRTVCLATPPLACYFSCATFRGRILSVEDVPRGTLKRPRLMRRLILDRLEVLSSQAQPRKGKPSPIDWRKPPERILLPALKVRIQGPLSRLKKAKPGDILTWQGSLTPPPPSLSLHGYDASFDLYFKGLSGFGKVAALVSLTEPLCVKKTAESTSQARKASDTALPAVWLEAGLVLPLCLARSRGLEAVSNDRMRLKLPFAMVRFKPLSKFSRETFWASSCEICSLGSRGLDEVAQPLLEVLSFLVSKAEKFSRETFWRSDSVNLPGNLNLEKVGFKPQAMVPQSSGGGSSAQKAKEILPQEGVLCRARSWLSEAIRQRLDPAIAPLATALVTGDRSGLSLRLREYFTRAGLSHMLAISGLHMGLVTGLVFWLFLRLLACFSPLAKRFPVKKLAALLTLPIAFAYLLLSGASFSAIRAFLMVSLAMLAILIDQRPISLRCTATAASVILAVFPESLFSVSFQLSFAAVAGLCWAYERGAFKGRRLRAWLERFGARDSKKPQPSVGGSSAKSAWSYGFQALARQMSMRRGLWALKRAVILLQQSFLTTLVATLATTPITLYVFQRGTLTGLLGNLLAVPVLSFGVIPLALLAVVSLAFGGSAWAFAAWGGTLKFLSNVAMAVAGLPGSACLWPRPGAASLVAMTLSALWLMIWQGKKRRLAVPVFVGSVMAFAWPRPPDVFIAEQGRIVGVREGEAIRISSLKEGSFHAKVWAQECGLEAVRPMTYAEADAWRERLAAWIPEERGDVACLWRQGKHFQGQETGFTRKRRPWTVGLEETQAW